MINTDLGYDENADWGQIPEYMRPAMKRYFEHGIHPGDFLQAVFNNDLIAAIGRADDTNATALQSYVRFLYNYAHPHSYGASDSVSTWIASRKAERLSREAAA